MPVEPNTPGQPTKVGLCVFDSEDDAQRFIDQQEPDSGYEPTPLEGHSIALIVDNEEVGTPDCIVYIGEYRDGEEVRAEPLSSDEFLRTIDKD